MIPPAAARRIAAVALPLLLLHGGPAPARPIQVASDAPAPPPTPASAQPLDPLVTQLPHISVATIGRGAPVVLIPGLATPRAVWNGVVAQLARDHRVYLVQVNGFAGDDPRGNAGPGVMAGIVADLSGYLHRQHVAPAAIVGHSLGGLAALMLARDHPAAVSRVMVVDALPFYGMLFGPTATVATIEPRGAAIRDQIVAGYGHAPDAALAERAAQTLALHPDAQARVRSWALAADARAVGWAMYADLTTDIRGDLPRIAAPVTVVYARNPAGPAAMADALYRDGYATLPSHRLVPVDGSGHFVMLDQPEGFAAALATFVAAG